MNLGLANDTKTILEYVFLRMRGSHFRKKFRRHCETLDIRQHLLVMYERLYSVVVAEAANDFAY